MQDNFPKSREAFETWKKFPHEDNRTRLRDAIKAEGGKIKGHGVIKWAKEYLQ